MTLHLDQDDVRRLVDLQETLLSPLDSDGPADWCDRVREATDALFRGSRAMVVIPSAEGAIHRWGPALDPWADVLEGMVTAVRPGAADYRHDDLDEALSRRRAAGFSVWTNAMVADLLDSDVSELSFYKDFLVPAETLHGGAMSVQLPMGEAMVGATPGPAGRPIFGEDWLDVFRLALPAFRAGVHAVLELQRAGPRLTSLMDALGLPLLVVDGRHREVHRTPALRDLLEGEDRADELVEVARRVGGRVAAGRVAHDAAPGAAGSHDLRLGGSAYHVRAVRLPPSAVGRSDLAVVTVECPEPSLPGALDLQERFGLTPREAEVALTLARGASNADAAERLGISPHTVRTHAERIFGKLGIRSRKALALHLMEGLPGG